MGDPLVICEGEFDAMLLDQELRGVPVVTLGSTVAERTDPDVLSVMLKSPEWFIALDADQAGDRAAAKFPAWAIRVRPPEGVKDWTELWQSGRNRIRYQWGRYLPLSKSWDVLAAQRRGPALENQGPTVISRSVGIQLENQL